MPTLRSARVIVNVDLPVLALLRSGSRSGVSHQPGREGFAAGEPHLVPMAVMIGRTDIDTTGTIALTV